MECGAPARSDGCGAAVAHAARRYAGRLPRRALCLRYGHRHRRIPRSASSSAVPAIPPGLHYLLPFGGRSRFLFKMDFAEAEYISRLRSGVKGHFSYRKIAWEMKRKMEELEPELGRLIQATPPWVEDPLKR